MFTGIIEEMGEIVAVDIAPGGEDARLRLRGPLVTSDAVHGASIAVNGVCLTVVDLDGPEMTADVMRETLARTTLGSLAPGDPVNLERALPASGRFGGHIVQGHVDGVATVTARTPGERWEVVRLALPPALARHVVEKGSIALDGTSLTVSAVGSGPQGPWCEVSLIPVTLAATTLGRRAVGEQVNVEVDILAKYVESMLAGHPGGPGPGPGPAGGAA